LAAPDDAKTGIIRRVPAAGAPPTTNIPRADAPATTNIPQANPADPAATTNIPIAEDNFTGLIEAPRSFDAPTPGAKAPAEPTSKTAVAACVMAMVSGWGTSVVATDLITGWWDTDRLFCAAVGFLALVFAASTITGVVVLLQGRRLGAYLVAAGAVVAVLAFGGVFIAGAKIPWFVYAIPVLPIASGVLALHPATRRWAVN